VYGASKLAGELYTLAYSRTYGLPVIVVRPFNTYGPREHLTGVYGEVIPRFVLRILNKLPPVIFGDGKQTRDFTYVSDTVQGIISASACDNLLGEKINIARGQEVSINQLAGVISEKLGRKDIMPVYEQQRPGDVMRHYADISKARQLVNFSPAVDIRTGIGLYIDWFNAQRFDISELAKQEVLFNW
jgi:UDP-glucose 4-epimerase